jgi:tetratricopeptide (TPR) repeat protein
MYEADIARDQKALNTAIGKQPIEQATTQLATDLTAYARYLGSQQRWHEEWTVLQEIQPPSQRPAFEVLESGAMTGHLDELLERYRSQLDSAPRSEEVLSVASSLERLGKKDLALQIEEFEYERELAEASPPASAWFGLAKVRFDQKRNEDALSLIRDVTLTVGAPFENLPEAVRVLEGAGLKDEAARYAVEWKTAEPWNEQAQFTFARLKLDRGLLNEIRHSPDAFYSVRVRAARLLRDLGNPATGADELSVLTQKKISATEASQPFYVEARLDAADELTAAAEKIRLYREAIAIDPQLRQARLNLAEAALSNGRNAFGLAVFTSYEHGAYRTAPIIRDGEQPGISFAEQLNAPSSPILLKVEELAAGAMTTQHEYVRAVQFYNQLLNTIADPARRAQMRKLRESADTKQKLEAANAARQPLVGDGITQKRIVKPKLKTLPADLISTAEPEPGEEH